MDTRASDTMSGARPAGPQGAPGAAHIQRDRHQLRKRFCDYKNLPPSCAARPPNQISVARSIQGRADAGPPEGATAEKANAVPALPPWIGTQASAFRA